jgi:hypothetical protein
LKNKNDGNLILDPDGRSIKAWLNIFCCSNSYTATVNEQADLPPGDLRSYVNQYLPGQFTICRGLCSNRIQR